MKLFISHSWMDKQLAQMTAEALQGPNEVWIDVERLAPGAKIQPTIDAAIREQELVILLWSAHAAASKNVLAEIASAKRFDVPVVPCLVDATPLDGNPDLAGLLGVDFREPRTGLFRLQIAVMERMNGASGLIDSQTLDAIKDFDGAMQYVHEYRNKKEIAGADGAAYWASKMIESTNEAYRKGTAWMERSKELLDLIQSTMARLQEAGNDRAAVTAIHNELLRHPAAETKELQQVIQYVADMLAKMPAPAAADFGSLVAEMQRKVAQASRAPLEPVRRQLQITMPAMANLYTSALELYVVSAPDSLRLLGELRPRREFSGALSAVAYELLAYLRNGDDVVPDGTEGIFGYLDDAWLIHNTIYACVNAGLLSPTDIPADWDTLQAANQLALELFAPAARQRLEAIMTRILAAAGIAPENRGTSVIQNATSIDDVYYQAGGRFVPMR